MRQIELQDKQREREKKTTEQIVLFRIDKNFPLFSWKFKRFYPKV